MLSAFRTVLLIALCQGLTLTAMTLSTTVTGLAGGSIAAAPGLDFLPLTMQALGTAAATLPMSHLMQRHGRRRVLSGGAAIGVVSGLAAAWAMAAGSFALLTVALGGVGAALAAGAFYRFAAAEASPEGSRNRAISLVLSAGLVASFAGPTLAAWAIGREAPAGWAAGFALPYLVLAGLQAVQIAVLQTIPFPSPVARGGGHDGGTPRPLGRILADRRVSTALIGGIGGTLAMGALMITTPPAMVACGFDLGSAAAVLQWHYVAMFAPAFVTGDLITRFGARPIIAAGGALCLAAVAVATGLDFASFWLALVLVGIGWNFMNTGSTALALTGYTPSERGKAEGSYSLAMSLTAAAAALCAGYLQRGFGWSAVLAAVLGALLCLLAVALPLIFTGRTGRPDGARP